MNDSIRQDRAMRKATVTEVVRLHRHEWEERTDESLWIQMGYMLFGAFQTLAWVSPRGQVWLVEEGLVSAELGITAERLHRVEE